MSLPILEQLPMPDRALDPEDFRFLINTHGARVKWYRAVPCPCRDPKTGQISRNCAICKGSTLYSLQDTPPNTKVFFNNAKKQVEDSQLGLILSGDLMAYSMPDQVPFERLDKLVVMDWELTFNETRTRGVGEVDTLTQRWPFAVDLAGYISDGKFKPVPRSSVLLDCDDDGKGTLKWLSHAPNAGQIYSLIYRYRPTVWVNGSSFMPSRMSFLPSPGGDPAARYGLPVRALMALKHPENLSPAT